MTQRNKSDALLRGIAQLFVDYRPADWTPVIAELEQGSALQRKIAVLIDELRTQPAPKKRVAAKTARAPALKHERKAKLTSLEKELKSGKLLADRRALAEVFASTGTKQPLPAARSAAITALIRQLNDIPSANFDALFAAIERARDLPAPEGESDYGRWFEIILNSGSRDRSLKDRHFDILGILDRAVVRGAEWFRTADIQILQARLAQYLQAGGDERGRDIVAEFLQTVSLAKDAPEAQQVRLNEKILQLKADWRALPWNE